MKKINSDLLDKMLEPQTSNKIMKESFQGIKPTVKEAKKLFIMFLIAIIPSFLIGYSENTISLFQDSVEKVNAIMLGMFGVVFTGYVFFQALVNDELLIRMLNQEVKKGDKVKSKL